MEEKGSNGMKGARETLITFEIGIILTGILFGGVGALFVKAPLQYVLGTAFGMLAACGIAVHLYITIDKTLDMPEEKASGYTRGMAMLRLVLMGIPVIVACLLPNVFNVLGVLFGLTGLKIGAYLQPGILKVIKKLKKEGEREC